ncbi:MAG: putative CocE/NonD family hydrolase [Chlamydiales bacterium]|jgi:putative CocE/NonD family hydrolase
MRTLSIVASLALIPAAAPLFGSPGEEQRRSAFGEYEGYSTERFDGWETTSTYVEMRDGVLLAVDITRPTRNGQVSDEALPLVWTHSRYHRRMAGRPMVELFTSLQRLLRHGYVVASACVRGGGASTGVYEGLFSEAETRDAIELIDWFVEQPFCDGNIGMYGGSYLGITQYMAASKAPGALKAIFPDVAAMDMYDAVHPGAIYRSDMMGHWARLTAQLDTVVPAADVDGDEGGALRKQAVAEHASNWDVGKEYGSGPYRDRDVPTLRWLSHGPIGYLDEINQAKIPAYHCNGWFDVFAMDAVLWFANFDGPQRLVMGDWSHAQMTEERARIMSVEQHRWFDRWLKGIENGVENEEPIQYALMTEPGQMTWQAASHWPPRGTSSLALHFGAGPSKSVVSSNDGKLTSVRPIDASFDDYAIDASTTTGTATRWDNAVGAARAMAYPDLANNDTRCLTYTTPILEQDLTVVGHPVVTLWLTAKKGDANLHVLLEEIDDRGQVQYVTEGVLRASQRKLAKAPFDNLGLPYQRCFEEDAEAVPADEPVEVSMDLLPTATVFNAGHRLRVTIMGADADNTQPSPLTDNSIRIHRGTDHDSRIELPVMH